MRIKHPSIVDVYDWGHGEDFRYIVTEYFPSGSLELRIRNLMTAKDSVDIFLQIAGALTAVHAAGLCHRDLKPANVMMRQDGRIVLIDFGLAKRVDSAVELTNAGEVRGSPYYISPEQAEGAPCRSAQRPLQPRRDVLRNADRTATVSRQLRSSRSSSPIATIQFRCCPPTSAAFNGSSTACWQKTRRTGFRRPPQRWRSWRG